MCIGKLVMTWEWEKFKKMEPNEKPKPIEKSTSTKIFTWFENNMIVFYSIWALLIIGFVFIMFWVTKNGSYWLFYESMVQDTIKEMVKPEYLIQLK